MPARLSLSRLLLCFPYYDALYFFLSTGLTIGYGDIDVKIAAGRLIAILIGFAGVLFTGLVFSPSFVNCEVKFLASNSIAPDIAPACQSQRAEAPRIRGVTERK